MTYPFRDEIRGKVTLILEASKALAEPLQPVAVASVGQDQAALLTPVSLATVDAVERLAERDNVQRVAIALALAGYRVNPVLPHMIQVWPAA